MNYVLTMVFLLSFSIDTKPHNEIKVIENINSLEQCELMRDEMASGFIDLGNGREDRYSIGTRYTSVEVYAEARGYCTEKNAEID